MHIEIPKVPAWLAAIALIVFAVTFLYVAIRQPPHFEVFALGFGSKDRVDLSMDGAVVAFDVSCPTGWTDVGNDETERGRFAGRMLIAAGPATPRANGASTTERAKNAQGGKEAHTLTLAEMPDHTHELILVQNQGSEWAIDTGGPPLKGSSFRQGLPHQRQTAPAGGGAPHNNMPPFIALYFCKKTG